MKAALALLLIASQAYACDWKLTESVDPMDDTRSCQISSGAAGISLFVTPDHVTFGTPSVYRNGTLRIRVDDNESIVFGRHRSTGAYFSGDAEPAVTALSQIMTGQRIRTVYTDYPKTFEGDAPICNLPELIRSCQAP
ncbi:hypothetical protein [Luteimonas saliphila]|uniref:hypothetical protein n=1 Tax=Luteimonas saliphila TaxID=2804919 RepID=UPI00192D7A20|nr:hypothetical protein [Luteimonas saliphila]